MSRLTASPFHKPSPFTFPREPVSPPETLLTESGYPPVSGSHPAQNESREQVEEHASAPFGHVETPQHSRISRPSVSYQNTGFREQPNRPVHRNYRFFVVVIPPTRLIGQHGQLGHTLASGPPQRLSQGIIMPLFPTMYSQLTAIAKEFNFPSITGLCLYLHINENGVVMTPRISDESWHMLWSHLFDMPSVPRGPPIGGRIEFDIDFQQARWYSAWLSTMARDHIERPFTHIPSTAPSIVAPPDHQHSIDGDLFRDSEQYESPQVPLPRHVPTQSRHVPRKLSLVDRFDIPVSRPENRAGAGQTLGLPDQGVPTSKLSPIAQSEEPQSAREQLDSRVKSWRANAITKPTSLAGRGQTSLDPVNLPNNLSFDGETPSTAGLEINLEDFTWSISSAGPDDYDVIPLGSPSERLPSPDMACRMLEDSPPTPSTATTWGAPLSYPPSPLSDFRPPSIDLAFRSVFSPPMTPATATSWGPLSPTSSFDWYDQPPQTRSIHLGERGEYSRPATPSTATTWGAPLSYPPSPSTPFLVHTPDVAQRSFDLSQEHGTRPWRSVWPYFDIQKLNRSANVSQEERTRPWRSVWPYFNSRVIKSIPHERVDQGSGYPFVSIYAPVYPHFDLYPPPAAPVEMKAEAERPTPIKVTLDSHYPLMQVYAPVYPHNLVIYPEVQVEKGAPMTIIVSSSHYPIFDLYPAVYPFFNLYPSTVSTSNMSRVPPTPEPAQQHVAPSGKPVQLTYGVYPNLVIYPVVYPDFNIYPGKAAEVMELKAKPDITPIKVALPVQYPNFEIYPAVYPNFGIYPVPAVRRGGSMKEPPVIVAKSQYPFFNLYPPVYPYFNLYPSEALSAGIAAVTETTVLLPGATAYPIFELYPAVYPNFSLYPPIAGSVDECNNRELSVLLQGATAYPTFSLYPVVYPSFSLYPSAAGAVQILQRRKISTTTVTRYPYVQIYHPVYPHLNIYPSRAAASLAPQPPTRVSITSQSTSVATKVHIRQVRKTHRDLHEEVFFPSTSCSPSDTGMTARGEVELRPLTVLPRHAQRRITATRSPTGPALHRPATPPALPIPSRRLPTPPPQLDGAPRSPNVGEKMAGFRSEVSPIRRYPPTSRSPSKSAVTATQRASMISPLRQMPLPRSADSWVRPDEALPITLGPTSSGLNRARSVGNTVRPSAIKSRIRDTWIVPRRPHDL